MAFEFRFKADEHHRPFWDKAFIAGSVVATFFQDVTLGAYIEGIQVMGRTYQGGARDWLGPFPLFTGFGLVVAYALLGCTWLILKTEGELQQPASPSIGRAGSPGQSARHSPRCGAGCANTSTDPRGRFHLAA